MKKLLCLLTLIFCTKIFAYSPQFAWLGSSDVFALEPVKDSILFGSGIALNTTEIIASHIFEINKKDFTSVPDKSSVNSLDRLFMNSYSKPLDMTADVFAGIAFASPLLFIATDTQSSPTLIALYIETLLLAKGTTDSLKTFAQRTRPCMYFNNYPQEFIDDGDWNKSWPSGHTTYTFATAAFLTYTYSKMHPDSYTKYIVAASSYAVALSTGILRIASGNHFLTDVLTGAVIGTAWGFFIPWLHTVEGKNNPLTITPTGFNLTFNL